MTRITAGRKLSYRAVSGELSESPDMPIQEAFLGLGGGRDLKRPTRLGQARHEHPDFNWTPLMVA